MGHNKYVSAKIKLYMMWKEVHYKRFIYFFEKMFLQYITSTWFWQQLLDSALNSTNQFIDIRKLFWQLISFRKLLFVFLFFFFFLGLDR